MYKTINVGFLILLSFVFVWANSPPMIELKHGMNEISIKVLNKSNFDFESVYVVVKNENLPAGFSIFQESQNINVNAKSKTENGILLRIKVTDSAKQGNYEIPFMLRDKANHSWSYNLKVKLGIQEPYKYELIQNHPNPFNANTHIKYALGNAQEQNTQLVIFDLMGKQIRTLINMNQSTGIYDVIWDGKDDAGESVSSGFYFYKITSGSFLMTRKMMLLK